LAAVFALLSAGIVVATLSKAAVIACTIWIPALFWASKRSAGAARVAVGAAAVLVSTTVFIVFLRAAVLSIDLGQSLASERYVRVGYWIAAVKMTVDHPLGVGIGNYAFYYPLYAPLSFRYEYQPAIADAHNLFLDALTETGVLGGMLFAAFVVSLFVSATRRARRLESSLGALVIALGFAFAAGATMHFTYSYFYFPFEWVLAGLLGAFIALPLKEREP
jgi:O-antigen ligase